MNEQKNPSIAALIAYAMSKASADSSFSSELESLLSSSSLASQNHVGFIFSERLINMPVEIMPHMYRMLADEIQWAIDDVSMDLEYVRGSDTYCCYRMNHIRFRIS